MIANVRRLLGLALLAACSGSSDPAPAPELAPDFLLLDVNPTSASFDDAVSPRDQLAKVSAWYFGDAT